ncbi:glycosyltransferase family 4 protein, partial [Vibrio splendidus]
FNLNLIKKVIKEEYTDLILGASWNNFNIILICILKRLGVVRSRLSFWTEANYLTVGARKGGFFKSITRRFILNTCDNKYLIPGKMSSLTLDKWKVNLNNRNEVIFPNLIDYHKYKISSEQVEERYNKKYIQCLIVARCDEEKKGILNFIKSIDFSYSNNFNIRIAGDGKDRTKYESFVCDNNLNSKVTFLGNLTESDMLKEYKSANLFILPSYSDPSPLSIVEAARMKLPILISERCGNKYETLIHEWNGYIFNPDCKSDICKSFNRFLDLTNEEKRTMGDNSFSLVDKNYNNKKVLLGLIDIL